MMVNIPGGIATILPPTTRARCDWGYWTVPRPTMGGRQMYWPRGKVVGGSSSINGMVYIRGRSSGSEHSAQLGLTGWGWADVLPYFRRSEDSDAVPMNSTARAARCTRKARAAQST